jgi:hypothetical protein
VSSRECVRTEVPPALYLAWLFSSTSKSTWGGPTRVNELEASIACTLEYWTGAHPLRVQKKLLYRLLLPQILSARCSHGRSSAWVQNVETADMTSS